MRILLVGCGSIGERHICNLRHIAAGEIMACDTDLERLSLMKKKYDIDAFTELERALKQKVDAVIVCTPPSMHIPVALAAINKNAHVFIEKPMSHTLRGVNKLIKKATGKKLVIFVGYNFRFHPGLRLVKKMLDKGKIGRVLSARAEFGQYLPDWRPLQDYRKSYTARKELGGGIILDGSHELDYMRWLLGEVKEVSCFASKLSRLEVDTEDTAKILLKFEGEAVAGVHLDFVRRGYTRNCELVGEKGNIIWSYEDAAVKVYSAKSRSWRTFRTKADPNDMYIEEVKHFLRCISRKEKPLIDVEDAKRTLEIALAAKRSARTGRMIKV